MEPPPTVVALIRFCRKELASLGERLELLNKTIGQYADAAYVAEERHRRNEESGEAKRRIISFDNQSKNEDQANKDGEHRVQNSIRWATWFAVIAASLYSLVAYRQYHEMISATGATQDAVHEARLSRQQTQRTFDATINQFHLDQRAWIGPVENPLIDWGAGKRFSVSVPIRNSGRTPGINLTTVAALRALVKGQVPVWTDLNKPTGHGVLQPSAVTYISVTGSGPVTQTEFDTVKSGDIVVWFWGRITYDDVFGRHHWTTFAQTFNPGRLGLDTYRTHNEVDQEKPN